MALLRLDHDPQNSDISFRNSDNFFNQVISVGRIPVSSCELQIYAELFMLCPRSFSQTWTYLRPVSFYKTAL